MDLFLKGSNSHGVRHADSERLVKGKLLLDIFEIGIPEQKTPSRMMTLEGGHVKDEIIMDENNLAGGLSILPHLLKVFEMEIVV